MLGYGEGKILHLLDEQGASVRSFGQPFRKGSELLAVTSTAGRVACGRSVAAAVSLDAPIVRLYDSTGSLLWEREIEGFRGLIVEPGPDGSVVHRRPEGGMHLNLGVVIVGDTLLVLQTGLFLQGPPDPRAPDSVVTRYYDLSTGRPGGSQAGLPVIGVIRDTLAVAVYGTPAPAFQVIRMTSRVAQ